MNTPQSKSGKERQTKSNNDIVAPVNDNITDDDIMKNLCIVCKVDMGDDNPRQLCGKTKCLNPNYYMGSDKDDDKDVNAFMSIDDFTVEAAKDKPLKWNDLPKDDIFQVLSIEEQTIDEDNGEVRIAHIAKIKNDKGTLHKVWLPSIVKKKLLKKMDRKYKTYMKPLQSAISQQSKRMYHDADVVSKKISKKAV